jgi:hypothetical protein
MLRVQFNRYAILRVPKRGLLTPTLAEDGVPIVLDSWMLGEGRLQGNSRIAYVLGGLVVFVEPKF